MAASLPGVLSLTARENLLKSKVLIIGAGGIGCEVLKNLVLAGFPYIEIIDLDTIDVSNLNRQFLFHREHVGKPKAFIARESALGFNPDVKIKAYHDSILSNSYGVNFFKKFNVVLSALDNQIARNHVNRMCLNADVPLIESGTAGYDGQVELIKKGLTQCYECQPKKAQKTFPGCTIRNTPSEAIHCIVWAKHLFNQLFGESTDEEDISPDVADPAALDSQGKSLNDGNMVRVSTRQWAKECDYDAEKLFNKFFFDDINYLLSMSNLWKTRKPPTPLKWNNVLLQEKDNTSESLRDYHKLWNLSECAAVFENCLKQLRESYNKLEEKDFLVWDKDNQPAMDFVAACSNIRSYIFGIGKKSCFETKAMAGNIIPAIATTNAITAGMVVLQAIKVLQGEEWKCLTVYTRFRLNPRNVLLVPEKVLIRPNPNCHVCSEKPTISIKVDTNKMRMKEFRDDVLIKTLNMISPEVIIVSISAIVISSEEDETEHNDNKSLKEMSIVDGVVLKADDFLQNYEICIIITHFDAQREDPLFSVVNKFPAKSSEDGETKKEETPHTNGDEGPSSSKKPRVDDDDDLEIIEDDDCDEIEGNFKVPDSVKVTMPPVNPYDKCITVDDDDEEEMTMEKVTEAVENSTLVSPIKETNQTISSKRRPEDESIDISNDDSSDEGPSESKRTKTMTKAEEILEPVESVEMADK